MEQLSILIMVVVTLIYTCDKFHRTTHTHAHTHRVHIKTGENLRGPIVELIVLWQCQFPGLIMCSSYVRCYLWRKLGEVYTEILFSVLQPLGSFK